MNHLLLDAFQDMLLGRMLVMIIVFIVVFIICVYITRWIFKIETIVTTLKAQNDYSLVQVRLLKKMLLNSGVDPKEIDDIIVKGNNTQK